MKYISFAILSISLLVGCQSTQRVNPEVESVKEITLEEFCLSNNCRKNTRITFRTDNGEVDETLPLYWPAARNNMISILPGDVLLIEAEVIDGKFIGNFKLVDEISNPNKTIKFSFTQMDSSLGMMLSVKNPFPYPIKYHLNMVDFSHNKHQTSSCPVGPKMSVFESWSHPIPELILTDMHRQEKDAGKACIY